ncbi:MAG TPA: hypothetical protein DHV36_24240 [Desulfobacteraceae bacterium]|nr:hypothetical protein [Desulfobacteraceae bacterium]
MLFYNLLFLLIKKNELVISNKDGGVLDCWKACDLFQFCNYIITKLEFDAFMLEILHGRLVK